MLINGKPGLKSIFISVLSSGYNSCTIDIGDWILIESNASFLLCSGFEKADGQLQAWGRL